MRNHWVKLYRRMLDSQMYKHLNSKQRDVLFVCLMRANYKPTEWEWGKEQFTCKPGQFVTSLESLNKHTGSDVSTQNIRSALKKLERWRFLTNKSTKTGRLITILNWRAYQGESADTNKDDNKELTKSQQRANKELTTNKKEDKNKNIAAKKKAAISDNLEMNVKQFVAHCEKSKQAHVKLIGDWADTLDRDGQLDGFETWGAWRTLFFEPNLKAARDLAHIYKTDKGKGLVGRAYTRMKKEMLKNEFTTGNLSTLKKYVIKVT